MVDQLTLQTIGILLTALTVSIAAIYYTLTLRYTRRNQDLQLETRQTQLFMHLFDKITAPEQRQAYLDILNKWEWKDFDDFMRKYGPDDNPEQWLRFVTLMSQFERMGLLVKDDLVNPVTVLHWLGSYPVRLWDKYESIIDEYRMRLEPPPVGGQWEWFEDLTYILRDVKAEDVKDFSERLARRRKLRIEYDKEIPEYFNR